MEIDVIEGLRLQAEDVKRFPNALGALRRLAVGLNYLDHNLRRSEVEVKKNVHPLLGSELHGQSLGTPPYLAGSPMELIDCAFQWYAVSLCNFVRTVAAIAFGKDSERRKSYSMSVLGNVADYRDKVAAHFAGTTKNERDNDAERLISLIPNVSWSGERFEVGAWTAVFERRDKTIDSKAIGPWSLTEIHEELCKRYPLIPDAVLLKNVDGP